MTAAALNQLVARARAAGPRQLGLLGRQLLVGAGVQQSIAQGIDLLQEAASLGDPAAALQLSVCAAWGVGMTGDISRALDFLAVAAQLGSQTAQHELRLLADDGSGDWARMRQRIDVTRWTAAREVRVVSESPRIVTIEGFCSAQECAWLIERGRAHLQRALVYRDTATARAADSRTNTEADFTIFRSDVVLNLIRARMASVLHTETAHFEITKLLHYAPGEQFGVHADFLQPDTPGLAQELEQRGQRVATFLIYLNDDYEAGETDFPRLGYRNKGRRGDALLFSNVNSAGTPDYDTLHAGLPPATGEKWLLSQWVRSRPVG